MIIMLDSVAASNFEALNTKSLEIRFDLGGTDYVALENIGTGAYGVVCSALNRQNGQQVAIKKIPDIFGQVTIAMRTYREIKILRHFHHDNIISIRDILQPAENELKTYRDVYIVLDLMESDLHRIIHSSQELSEEHVRYFLYQILRGLKYIHSANIVHRDLKPSNLLVNENCELKIGDFGMARGISSSPDEYNMKMTQYVATRWYRAPELMLLTVNYTAAIDMWSVGCILAEMLGRRHLFPGQNYRHQLELIFRVVGSPSDDYINQTSELIGDFLRRFEKKDPADLRNLYPSASRKAVELIGKMLKLEPDHRMSAECALKSTYLSRYHDPDDEPVCVPVFDFSFEKQDMDAGALREVITREMMEYKRPKLVTAHSPYSLCPVSVERGNSQLRSAEDSSVACQPTTCSDANNVNSVDQLSRSVETTDSSITSPKLQVQPPFSAEQVEVAGNSVEMQNISLHSSAEHSEDVTMLSAQSVGHDADSDAKLQAEISQCTDSNDNIDVKDNRTNFTVDDVEDTNRPITTYLSVNTDPTQTADAKARIKAALLNSGRRRQRLELSEIGSKMNKVCRGVTALQRQREREEQRRLKRERALERRKKKNHSESNKMEGPLLSEQDRTLLEHWKSIYPSSSQSRSSDDSQVTPFIPCSTDSNSSQTCSGLVIKQYEDKQQNDWLQPRGLDVSSMHRPTSLRTDNFHIENSSVNEMHDMSTFPPFMPSSVAFTGYLPPFNMQPRLQLDAAAPVISQSALAPGIYPPHNNHIQCLKSTSRLLTPLNQTQKEADFDKTEIENHLLPSYSEAMKAHSVPLLPSTAAQSFTDLHTSRSSIDPMYLCRSHESQTVDVDDAAAGQWICGSSGPLRQLVEQLPSVSECSRVACKAVNELRESPAAAATDELHVITSRLMKSHVDDLTLHHTPRGTGAGYGVGCNEFLPSLFTSNLPSSTSQAGHDGPDSAPLSATLMADWRSVTGDMDASDLVAVLQVELQEMGSPRINLADLSSVTDSRYLSP